MSTRHQKDFYCITESDIKPLHLRGWGVGTTTSEDLKVFVERPAKIQHQPIPTTLVYDEGINKRFELLEQEVSELKSKSALQQSGYAPLQINRLISKSLKQPITALLEKDDDGFIARSTDVPVYGFGDDPYEATTNLRHELESLYFDLLEDDNFSPDWLDIKKFLVSIVD
jgi:hypothetical protein